MEKKYALLSILNSTNYLSSKIIANKLNCSIRTIRKYVNEINLSQDIPIILSSNQGYKLSDNANVNQLKKNFKSMQDPYDRLYYIAKKILDYDQGINLYDISDELFISEATLRKDLTKISSILKNYNLHLSTKNDYIKITGDEKNKRDLVKSILYKEANNNLMNIEFIQETYPDYNIEFIKYILTELFNKYHYYINDYALINLILYIVIAMDRIDNNSLYTENSDCKYSIKQHEMQLTIEIIEAIQEHYQIIFNDSELLELTLLIIGCTNTFNESTNLKDIVSPECLQLTDSIINNLTNKYFLDLNDEDFIYRFTIHINGLLIRCQNSFFTKNPLTENLKRHYPVVYDYATTISHIIKKETGYIINDDEIAFLAFHIGMVYEKKHLNSNKLSTLIISPHHYNLNMTMVNRIKNTFNNTLDIKNVVPDTPLSIDKYDLVISTIQLNTLLPNAIYIDPFFSDLDQQKISNKIDEIIKKKKKIKFKKILHNFTDEYFFSKQFSFNGKYEAISFMCQQMISQKITNDLFLNDVLERESLSSTSFNSVAIPHSTNMNAYKTMINFCILEKPLLWDNNKVYLILLVAINHNDESAFAEIYDFISSVLMDDQQLDDILKANNYSEFINKLEKLL